jgi:choline-glycine betaine transporter
MKKIEKLADRRIIAFLTIGLFISAIIMGRIAEEFRFSDARTLYIFGILLKFTFWIVAVGLSIFNTTSILQERNKQPNRNLYLIISIIPILYIIIGVALALIMTLLLD